jgi:predicted AAA+ superfamily ATPase
MFGRLGLASLLRRLHEAPAVVLTGARQTGKTTLAWALANAWQQGRPAGEPGPVYLDLQSPADRARLADPVAFLAPLRERQQLVILDEVHHQPGLFPLLRGQIDAARRESPDGRATALYLLLGSAALPLLRQAGETMAGRAAYFELAPLTLAETAPSGVTADAHWLRGGFPDSLRAPSDAASLRWREDFIRSYLERELPQFAPRLSPEALRRFWTMLAHRQGAPFNASDLARSLGVDSKTVGHWLDLAASLLLVRRLTPWHANIGKRLVKSPKVYLRDSGLVHALLGIATREQLLGHPVAGASWEGMVIENVLAVAAAHGAEPQASFYRSTVGAEIDLVLTWADGSVWAIEIKRSLAPSLERGFFHACEDVKPQVRWLAYPGTDRFPLNHGVVAVPLSELLAEVAAKAAAPNFTPPASSPGAASPAKPAPPPPPTAATTSPGSARSSPGS